MSAPTVFVSSGSKDTIWRDQVVQHLGVYTRQSKLEVWHRDLVQPGQELQVELHATLHRAAVAVVFLSAESLNAEEPVDAQERELLSLRSREGLQVLPVVARPCLWQRDPFWMHQSPCPPGAPPLSSCTPAEADANLMEVANEVAERILEPAPARAAEQDPDSADLLPYLVNLLDQHLTFRQALREYLEPDPHPVPLIFLVHGDENQSHEMFLRCLQERWLPMLGAFSRQEVALDIPLKWPTLPKLTFMQLRELLVADLAQTVLRDSYATERAVNDKLAAIPAPILIHTNLLSAECKQGGAFVIDSFLQFWQSWEPLLPGQRLLVFLFLKYQIEDGLSPWIPFRRWFARRPALEALNERVARHVAGLGKLEAFDRLRFWVLPRLIGVSRQDAENWAREEGALFRNSQRLVNGIRDFFEDRGNPQRIPMDDMAEELQRQLRLLDP